ncbi:hypothetical protein [Spirosoma endophyticum]|uniref:DKNYY family protein n=1 Tax=Spirosoma endophyticum TaxID=662367 RepID=A0A1I2FWC8_9BACT|nr:hypothetical protein [Spirosoma endophyticum]SFF09243.1 hypothetical protein SAMN05216167_12814 [Spirosoma endophyticum]
MRNIILLFVVSILFALSAFAQEPIVWDKLYSKRWRLDESSVLRPNNPDKGTLVLYSRGNFSRMNLDNRQMYFNEDGTGSGSDVEGNAFSRTWKFEGNNGLWAEGDRRPAEVVKLTDRELILQVKQTYKSPYTNEEEFLIAQDKYVLYDPCAVYESLRSGDWNDPTLWTCQQIPTINNKVQINKNHKVVVPDNYTAYAQTLRQNGKLNLKQNAKLVLGK